MQIPKYIEKALERRVNAAEKFNNADIIISDFIEKYDIDVEIYDYHGGVESIVNPDDSAERIRQAIQNHKN